MLKTKSGMIILVTNIVNNNNVQIEVFKDQTMLDSFNTKPTKDNEPERLNVYVNTIYTDLQKSTTSLGGKSLAEVNSDLAEQAVLTAVNANPRLIPRLKWESIDLTIV